MVRRVGIHLVAQLVEHPMVVHISALSLVEIVISLDTPADDGGVVVVLVDQLLHLADGIFPAIGQMLGDVGISAQTTMPYWSHRS